MFIPNSQLKKQGLGSCVLVRATTNFSCLHELPTGYEAHPALFSMGSGALSQRIKRQNLEADLSYSVDIKNEWSYIPLPLYVSIACKNTTLLHFE
jgi:hypothetical protein